MKSNPSTLSFEICASSIVLKGNLYALKLYKYNLYIIPVYYSKDRLFYKALKDEASLHSLLMSVTPIY